eukprot:Gregarina_sp_Pseudo_9__1278@NODE_184_length_3775_cov_18_334850_g167_i1_p2_GENE_NODE_184_length_3775_cov_18_334850_g167_i1NODE_184_length_3775_cov_18_334850_g167_i1_p2_ORF_typecomplete_len352_score53_50SNARE_assoc/PF09335_11/3_6e15SNARE_assoc/PF09335_11/9_1e02DUF2275/PF10039_9/2_8e02DUF2275/PF10039_9/4_2e03DUF2275/PF10039_9/2_6MadM/PF03818_13/1_7e03MadM/PF03818_13/0_82FtsL/PF04999_13/7_6e03FtsL/PF04999_13/0_56DUF3357/PF11837_8/3e02DUF3357/PF11837_8/1_5e04DUF3357/PF11837_8/1_9_NODE_184_length_3775
MTREAPRVAPVGRLPLDRSHSHSESLLLVSPSGGDASHRRSCLLRALALALKISLALAVVGLGYLCAKHKDSVLALLDKGVAFRNRLGWWYPVLYFAVHFAAITFFIPAELVTISGGFLFTYDSYFGYKAGIAVATLVTTASLCLGTALLFFVSRNLLKARLLPHLRHLTLMQAFLDVLSDGGLWLALLLRLVPVMPFSLGNVIFGLTDLPFPSVLLSVIGTLPGTFLFCWIGADCTNIQSILEGRRESDTRDTLVTAFTLVLLAILVFYIVSQIRQRIATAAENKVEMQTSQQSKLLTSQRQYLSLSTHWRISTPLSKPNRESWYPQNNEEEPSKVHVHLQTLTKEDEFI